MPPRRANPPFRIIVAPYGMDNLEGCRLAWAEDPDELDDVVECGVWREAEPCAGIAYVDLITIGGRLVGIAFRPYRDDGDRVCERLIADGMANDDGWGVSYFFNPRDAQSPKAKTATTLDLTELFFDKDDRPMICVLLSENPKGLKVSRNPAHAFDLLPFTPMISDQ